MKKIPKLIALLTAMIMITVFFGCSNPSSSDNTTSSSNSNSGNTTTNPFAGTVWKQALNGELLTTTGATTITFASSGKTVTVKNYISHTFNYNIVDSHTAYFYYGNVTTTGLDFVIDSSNPNKATLSSIEFLKQ